MSINCWNIYLTLFLPLTTEWVAGSTYLFSVLIPFLILILFLSNYISLHNFIFFLLLPNSLNNVHILSCTLTLTYTYMCTTIYFRKENQRIVFLYLRKMYYLLNVAFIIKLNSRLLIWKTSPCIYCKLSRDCTSPFPRSFGLSARTYGRTGTSGVEVRLSQHWPSLDPLN